MLIKRKKDLNVQFISAIFFVHILGKLVTNTELLSGQPFFVKAMRDIAGSIVMGDYPIEEPFFTKMTAQPSNERMPYQCFLAFYNDSNKFELTIRDSDCQQNNIYVCQNRLTVLPECSDGYPSVFLNSTLDILWDPRYEDSKQKTLRMKKNQFINMMNRLDHFQSYKNLIHNLWFSSLPCFDIQGVTAEIDDEKSILKYCEWKGIPISCSAIFTTFPTDRGMCCSFNMKAANDIFFESTYTTILKNLQEWNKNHSLSNSSLPTEFTENLEPKTSHGQNNGLLLILDAHSDLFSPTSVDSITDGFVGYIGPRNSFPFVSQEGFFIKPGHSNTITLSGYQADTDNSLRSLTHEERNCRFSDESSDLKIFKIYSYTNCIFECSILFAKAELKDMTSDECVPWYIPSENDSIRFCNPWDAYAFQDFLNKVKKKNI